ncbi:MAG: DUF2171 domain-containing protein [Chloroflexi bacterium]|nr:DUF2171 domain-containing protein [Chloroflexota bacterium]
MNDITGTYITDDEPGDSAHKGEILKANVIGADQIQEGMDVMSIDGHPVGKVKEVRSADFLLDRPLARDLYVPFSSVLAAEDYGGSYRRGPTEPTQVVLEVNESDIDSQGWTHS